MTVSKELHSAFDVVICAFSYTFDSFLDMERKEVEDNEGQLLHQPPLPPGSILPWARSLSPPSRLSSLDTDSRSEGATWSLETRCGFEIYLATRVFTGGEYRAA